MNEQKSGLVGLEPFAPEAESGWYSAMEQYWHAVAYAKDLLENQPLAATLLGRSLALVRTGGEVHAFSDICRHRGASLSLGSVQGDCLVCPYHGWEYDMQGEVVRIPSRPELSGVFKARLDRFPCQEAAGMIWVSLVETPWGAVPQLTQWNDSAIRWQTPAFYDWKTSVPRRLENFVDFSHFPYVHEHVLGSRDKPEVEDHDVWREDQVLRFVRWPVEPNEHKMKELLEIDEPLMTVENQYHLAMPATITLERIFPNGRRYILFMSSSPLGPGACRNFWHIGSDFSRGPEDEAYLLDFEDRVLAQDKPIVESQLPERLPDNLDAEMYVKIADSVTLNYRQWLLDLSSRYLNRKDQE